MRNELLRKGEAIVRVLKTEGNKHLIEKRNKWMIAQSDYCICYITHTWGGAYKFARQAKRKGLHVINLGSITFEGSTRRGKKA